MTKRTYVALDLETTGVDATRDAIIEIGAVRFRGDAILDRFSTLVDPQRRLPLRIQQITGISEQDLEGAPTFEDVAPELLAFVDRDVHAVVAHNVSFDIGFLKASGVHFHRPELDTYELATMMLPGLPSYSLGELCEGLAISLDSAHRALADAEAAAELAMHIFDRVRDLPTWLLRAVLESAGESSKWAPLQLFRDALRERGEETNVETLKRWNVETLGPVANRQSPIANAQMMGEVDGALVDRCFADDGVLAGQIEDGYEVRSGQVQMAHLVLKALNEGRQYIVEAGTGTGKSLAYLFPVAAWAVTNGQRVVIATDTITLQEQLLNQEIPRVQAVLNTLHAEEPLLADSALSVALLKGRSHYLCTRRLRAWRAERSLSALELRLLTKVLVWLPGTETGDLSELVIHDSRERALLRYICSDSFTCTEERCGDRFEIEGDVTEWAFDFYWAARIRAERAHLLVINHALLMADLENEGQILPRFDHLVIDEAHRLEDAATEQMTYRIDGAGMQVLLRSLQLTDETLAHLGPDPAWRRQANQMAVQSRRVLPQLKAFVDTLIQFVDMQTDEPQTSSFPQRVSLEKLRLQPRWGQMELEWDTISQQLEKLADLAGTLVEELDRGRRSPEEPRLEAARTMLSDLQRAARDVTRLNQEFSAAIFQPVGQPRESVGWLEVDLRKEELTFCTAPLHVSELLENNLFQRTRTVILTGATLRTDEGFDFMRDRLGCWNAEAAAVDSPFNFQANALLYLPSDIPAPNRPGYQTGVEQAIVETARAAQGRTMVLFTSYAHLRATAGAIRGPLDQNDITVLEHGFSSRSRLLREFRGGGRAVLLGTGTFWEGIDLPGEMLSCLLIVRLPFAVPTDPLVQARSRAYDEPFYDYTVPDAVLRFRQGFGRLIRRADDRGVVVVLDSRAWQKSYGSAFLDALPACTVRRAPLGNLSDSVRQWLANESWFL